MPLRVVTLNLWGMREPFAARLGAAAAALAALELDVILLQEVIGGEPDTATRLAAALGGAWRAQFGAAAGTEGLAILARAELHDAVTRPLPEARPDEQRVLLSARLRPGLWCHTTHLHYRMRDGVARERQVLAIDAAVAALGEGADAVHILGGDFNAAPDCDEIRFLRGRHTLDGRRAYWQDAFAVACPDDPGHTWSRRNPHTELMPWLERDRRIDYLFVSPERKDGRARILDARVVLDAPDAEGVWPSDHFAVFAEIAD